MQLATDNSTGPRQRAFLHALARLVPKRLSRPLNASSQPGDQAASTSLATRVTHHSPELARAELLSQVRAGLRLVECQRELLDVQIAEQRYYRDALAEYMATISTGIKVLERRQAQLESIAAELRQAEQRLDG